jgi:hypothetical protein
VSYHENVTQSLDSSESIGLGLFDTQEAKMQSANQALNDEQNKITPRFDDDKSIREISLDILMNRIIDQYPLDYDSDQTAFADIGNERVSCYVPVHSQPFIQMMYLYSDVNDIELTTDEHIQLLHDISDYAIDHGEEINAEYTLEDQG